MDTIHSQRFLVGSACTYRIETIALMMLTKITKRISGFGSNEQKECVQIRVDVAER